MPKLDKDRQKELEPKRMNFAIQEIQKIGCEIIEITENRIDFVFDSEVVQYFPYSGWHTGKSITDGRGWKKLYNQIKQ